MTDESSHQPTTFIDHNNVDLPDRSGLCSFRPKGRNRRLGSLCYHPREIGEYCPMHAQYALRRFERTWKQEVASLERQRLRASDDEDETILEMTDSILLIEKTIDSLRGAIQRYHDEMDAVRKPHELGASELALLSIVDQGCTPSVTVMSREKKRARRSSLSLLRERQEKQQQQQQPSQQRFEPRPVPHRTTPSDHNKATRLSCPSTPSSIRASATKSS